MSSVTLLGGIKGCQWVAAGEEYTSAMNDYGPTKWNKMQD